MLVLAAITFEEIIQLILLITIVHAVLLGPFVLAGFLSWLEYRENQSLPRKHYDRQSTPV